VTLRLFVTISGTMNRRRRQGKQTLGLLLLALFASGSSQQGTAGDGVVYEGCSIEEYYNGLLSNDGSSLRDDVTRAELEELLESTHRKVLPYTGSNDNDDVWKALIDLDAGDTGTVRLVYRQVDVPAYPHGTTDTWNREHLWPKSRGVEYTGPDFTDIHHLRPADWNVNSARNNLFFGDCGLVAPSTDCTSPAHPEASADTASDAGIFRPPAVTRGDIARALFYMDMRYSSQNNIGIDLVITDCPSQDRANEMAYKSQLLMWHIDDPVTEEEMQRNQRACERWQGNRNPFVDFPDAVQKFFGEPQLPLGDGRGYANCTTTNDTGEMDSIPISTITGPTPAPAISNTDDNDDNPCKSMSASDIFFVAVNADSPDLVAFATLKDLKEGLVLYLTDNAWTGSQLRTNEGTVSFQVPTGGIPAGTVFGYGASTELLYGGDWENVQGQFQPSLSGDNLLLYCQIGSADEVVRFLSALDYSGLGWAEANLEDAEEYGTSETALPVELAEPGGAGVVLPNLNKQWYVGSTKGSAEQLQEFLGDPNMWLGSNDDGDEVVSVPGQFSISSAVVNFSKGPAAGDVMVVAINSDDPDMVAIVALTDLPGNLDLYMTDNAWIGSEFLTNEGTLMLTLPSLGVEAGTIFGYGGNLTFRDQWQTVGGRFSLAETGDAVILYSEVDGNVQHLSALSYSGVGNWTAPGLSADQYGTADSALPESLKSVGAVSLPRLKSFAYMGPVEGNTSFLQGSIQNISNWKGSDTNRAEAPMQDFRVEQPPTPNSLGRRNGFRMAVTITLAGYSVAALSSFLL
jgi:endonuclease I